MTYISGARGTNSDTDRRKYDISDKIWLVDPDYATIVFFARKVGKQVAVDPEYRHFEYTQPSRYSACASTINSSNTTLAVTTGHGLRFREGDIVVDVSTGEHVRVTGISTDNLTIVRGWGTTSAASITSGDVLVIIGNANAEGGSVRTQLSNVTSKIVNYTQIFREPIKLTGTSASTEYYGEAADMTNLRRTAFQMHMKDLARSWYFGEKKEDLSGSQPIRATAGFKAHISTNVLSTATLTEPLFDGFMEDIYANGGSKKMGFFSPLIVSAINSWAKSGNRLTMYPKDKTFGVAVSNYLTGHGEIDFTEEKILNENAVWYGHGFVADMTLLKYRFLGGNGKSRDTRLLPVTPTNGEDSVIEEYLTEAGFQLINELQHGYIKSVTAYS